jgi:hypothetical protein
MALQWNHVKCCCAMERNETNNTLKVLYFSCSRVGALLYKRKTCTCCPWIQQCLTEAGLQIWGSDSSSDVQAVSRTELILFLTVRFKQEGAWVAGLTLRRWYICFGVTVLWQTSDAPADCPSDVATPCICRLFSACGFKKYESCTLSFSNLTRGLLSCQ